jgi:hypothetical protein
VFLQELELSFLEGVGVDGVDVVGVEGLGGLVLQLEICEIANIGTIAKIKNKFFIGIVLYL